MGVAFKLVRGTHPEMPMPRAVRRRRWAHRVALVLDSYRPDGPDMYFHVPLFLHFLQTVEAALGATACRIRLQTPRPLVLDARVALQTFYAALPEGERDLPETVQWFCRATAVGAGFPERWYRVGGPPLYHDSFTFSVFTPRAIDLDWQTLAYEWALRFEGSGAVIDAFPGAPAIPDGLGQNPPR